MQRERQRHKQRQRCMWVGDLRLCHKLLPQQLGVVHAGYDNFLTKDIVSGMDKALIITAVVMKSGKQGVACEHKAQP